MKIQPAVRTETVRIAMGTAFFSLVMLLVFALLDRLDVTVVLGTLLGAGAAVLNFFLMALSVQRAAESMKGVTVPPEPLDENGDPDPDAPPQPPVPEVQRAKRWMQLSYTGRMLLLVGGHRGADRAVFPSGGGGACAAVSAPGDLFAGICQAKEQGGLNADET